MHHNAPQLPKETYHRLYWYAKRNVDPSKIASALNLPLQTVLHLIGRLNSENSSSVSEAIKIEAPPQTAPAPAAIFLDIFVFSKSRYLIVDLNGFVCKETAKKLKEELKKIAADGWLPIALRMADTKFIDAPGIETVLAMYGEFKSARRYMAILDPSPEIEPLFKEHDIDAKIPVFGTEGAFEDHAF